MKSTSIFLYKNPSRYTFRICAVDCMQIKPKSKSRLCLCFHVYMKIHRRQSRTIHTRFLAVVPLGKERCLLFFCIRLYCLNLKKGECINWVSNK